MAICGALVCAAPASARAQEGSDAAETAGMPAEPDRGPAQSSDLQELREARDLYESGQYFKSARYAFAAAERGSAYRPQAYAWITLSLIRANLDNAASYFFIKTLQSGDRAAIRRVLGETQGLLVHVGGDLLRNYLIRHTRYEDYDPYNRAAYLYALGKQALLAGQEEKAVGYLSGIPSNSPVWPFALQLRASAQAILGRNESAIGDFRECADRATRLLSYRGPDEARTRQARREGDDLRARCLAGEARTLYQSERFEEADQAYDQIEKHSFVWPDILFEQAWNAYARREYNRTLGKLVSYKSPALTFVFNSEVDVLNAQTYLALCLYDDANQVINEFNGKYARLGEEAKSFVERNHGDLGAFFDLGKRALGDSLYSRNELSRMLNRFVRGPYFQNMAISEREVSAESAAIKRFAAGQAGADRGGGFPGFLEQVLRWRVRTIRMLGGAFVKNSMMDYHAALVADFEKMAFIKLEMLKRAKEKLIYKKNPRTYGDRNRGNIEPGRKDYQYYWSFNGEFWNDELGDYVFGLESECGQADSGD